MLLRLFFSLPGMQDRSEKPLLPQGQAFLVANEDRKATKVALCFFGKLQAYLFYHFCSIYHKIY